MSIDDPTMPMREYACTYPDVDEGTACTQTSFKVKGKSFFFAGPQGGRFKAMFKLKESREEAQKLATESPENYEVGSGAWVTVRFADDKTIPQDIWQRWLDESYALSAPKKK